MKLLGWPESLELAEGYLVTVNMQHLYECQSNELLRRAVFEDENSRLCLDGRGAHVLFERSLRTQLPVAVGNEVLFGRLSRSAGKRVLVLGADTETIAAVRRIFSAVEFAHDGSLFRAFDEETARATAARITAEFGTDFDLIAIALGVPKQEILAQALSRCAPKTPIYCIGGSFEIITRRLRRAPPLMRSFGLEGAWRMLIQPNRRRLERLVRSYWNFVVFFVFRTRLRTLIKGAKDGTDA